MRFFLISCSVVLLLSCKSYFKKEGYNLVEKQNSYANNGYFSNPKQDYIYKAQINVFDKQLGGIFIVKKIGTEHHRVALTTEMGNKIFDFEFHKNTFTVKYIMPELNKKIVINLLKKDFKVLLLEQIKTLANYTKNNLTVLQGKSDLGDLYYTYNSNVLTQVIRANFSNEKVGFYFSEINDNIARNILIDHKKIKLKINLKYIN